MLRECSKHIQLKHGSLSQFYIQIGSNIQLRVFELCGITFIVFRRSQYTVVVQVIQLRIILHISAASRCRERNVVSVAVFSKRLSPPIYVGIGIGLRPVSESGKLVCIVTWRQSVVLHALVQGPCKGVSVYELRRTEWLCHVELIGEPDGWGTACSPFRLYDDNPIATSHTI